VTFLADALPKQTEKQFMSQVVRYAELMGWRVHHTFDSRKSSPGVPDLLCIRRPRVVWAELKSDRGRLTDDQRAWLLDLRACGQEAYLWSPRNWSAVEKLLR
jgi:hypothetical protein